MPCTQNDDNQESQQPSRRAPFSRSTFSRAFAGLRFSDQQNFNSFRISPSHPSHIIVQPSVSLAPNNPEDLTEQIRINVHEANFGNQRAPSANGDLGGNVSDVLDNFEGAISQQQEHRLPSYGGQSQSIAINDADRSNSSGIVSHVDVSSSTTRPQSAQSSIEQQGPSSAAANTSSSSTSSSSQTMSSRLDMTDPGQDYAQSSHAASSIRTPHHNDDSDNARIKYDESLNNNKTSTSSNDKRQPQDVSAILTENQSSDNTTHVDEFDKNSVSSAIDQSKEKEQNSSSSSSDILPQQQENISNDTDDSSCADKQLDYEVFDDDDINQYLHVINVLPPYTTNRQAGVIKNYLYNGSNFSGYQKNKKDSYEVKVQIQFVDFDNSYLCGYLNIKDLTQSHPLLTTFFEGEIISKEYPFLTRKWEATEEIDRAHWSKLDGFEKYVHTFNLDSFNYDDLEKSDYIYMRWKEHFFVPDHTIKHVEGTSYAGFYYVCYNKRTKHIKGYYFHITEYLTGSFQLLNLDLEYSPTSQVFEFR